MPRKPRLEYEGAIYHLMNRGERKGDIVVDDQDRERFLETLGEACQKTDWQVHAYCPKIGDGTVEDRSQRSSVGPA